jgi:hypothetical protein
MGWIDFFETNEGIVDSIVEEIQASAPAPIADGALRRVTGWHKSKLDRLIELTEAAIPYEAIVSISPRTQDSCTSQQDGLLRLTACHVHCRRALLRLGSRAAGKEGQYENKSFHDPTRRRYTALRKRPFMKE